MRLTSSLVAFLSLAATVAAQSWQATPVGPTVAGPGWGYLAKAPFAQATVPVFYDSPTGVTYSYTPIGWSVAGQNQGPMGYYYGAMAGNRLAGLFFGGFDPSTGAPSSDTFAYAMTGGTASWAPVSPGVRPPARSLHSMVSLDTIGGSGQYLSTLVFGGYDGSTFLNDIWSYNYLAGTWVQLAPTGALPTPRVLAAMAEGPDGTVTMFGGTDATGQVGDTWSFVPTIFITAWTQIPGNGPSPRQAAGLAWDPARRVTVLQGGNNITTSFSDTWELRRDSGAPLWRPCATTGSPVTIESSLALDVASNRVVAASGASGNLEGFDFTPSVAAYSTISATPWMCSGVAGPLQMTVQGNSLPVLGQTFPLEFRNADPTAALVFGLEAQPVTLPFPPPIVSPGCFVYQVNPGTVVISNLGTLTPIPLPIPNSPALIGLGYSAQGYHVDLITGVIKSTTALSFTIGT